MRLFLLALAASGLLFFPYNAEADTFNFSASALGYSTSGTFTATNNGDGSYSVTGVTGTGILGLIPAGDAFFGNDNLIFPNSPRLVDVNGLGFTGSLAGQTYSADLFSTVSGFDVLALDGSGTVYFAKAMATLSSAAAATPEPSSLMLLGTGLLGTVVTVLRRRFVR